MKILFTTSWVLLLVVSAAIVLASAQSLLVAYGTSEENITGSYSTVEMRAQAGDDAVKALKGRRVTAASWALAYGLLALVVTFVPYRRGEQWAWWALLVSIGLSQLLSMARVITLGRTVGAGTSGILLALMLLGLMAGAPRLFLKRETPPEV